MSRPARPISERFWENVEKGDGCWEWTLSKNSDGYGWFAVNGSKNVKAHRMAYELVIGPIPEGLQLDHLCRNRGCVRPAHLEPVTHTENVRRSASANKDTCKNGLHPWPDSAVVTQVSTGKRQCGECRKARSSERHHRELA